VTFLLKHKNDILGLSVAILLIGGYGIYKLHPPASQSYKAALAAQQEFAAQQKITLGNHTLIAPINWTLLEALPDGEPTLKITLIPKSNNEELPSAGISARLEKSPENPNQDPIEALLNRIPENSQILKPPQISKKNPKSAQTTFLYTTRNQKQNETWLATGVCITDPNYTLYIVLGVTQSKRAEHEKAIRETIALLGI